MSVGIFRFLIVFELLMAGVAMANCTKTSCPAPELRVKIAVIDTGLKTDFENLSQYLCKTGSYNFVNDNEDIYNTHGHGTNVAYLITRNLDPTKYCLLIYKYYSNSGGGYNNSQNEIRSFHAANMMGAQYINYSGGGDDPALAEEQEVKIALSRNARLVVAAGNNGLTICTLAKYYPACYPTQSNNFYVVGNCTNGQWVSSSNRGPGVNRCRNGMGQGPDRLKMSGTSQSTAIFMNELILDEAK